MGNPPDWNGTTVSCYCIDALQGPVYYYLSRLSENDNKVESTRSVTEWCRLKFNQEVTLPDLHEVHNKPSRTLNPDLDVLQHTVEVNIILWSRRYGSAETDKNKKKQNSLLKQGNTWMNAHT